MNYFNKEHILSIPKIINEKGCWIPNKKTDQSGYVRIMIDRKHFMLHRVVMCLYHNIDYNNYKIETRHGKGCDRACFNYEHLKPGSISDNERDKIEHKTNHNTKKENCPKCGSKYRIQIYKYGWNKGRTRRYCAVCRAIQDLKRHKNRMEIKNG
jgi:hypothetical protein